MGTRSAAMDGRRWQRQASMAAAAAATGLLMALLLVGAEAAEEAAAAPASNEDEVREYLQTQYEPSVSRECNRLSLAEWGYETNITDETTDLLQNASLRYAAFEKDQWEQHFSNISFENFTDESLKRQLESLRILGVPVLEPKELEAFTTHTTRMSTIYSTAQICPYKKPNCTKEEMMNLDPEIEGRLSTSTDYGELQYLWEAWREASGMKMFDDFQKYVELSNKAAVLNGFSDMGDMWRNDFDSDNLREDVLRLWTEIRPLYDELHTFVSRRLKAFYGDLLDVADGLLPAHVLGNMWAQSWGNIFDLVKPFEDARSVNVTGSLQDLTVKQMFEMSDEFYRSLGLPTNNMSFSDKAMLERPDDRQVTCHASAWDLCDGQDFRIKMCTKKNMEDFVTIHHEMGHIQYYLQYKDQPYVFRKGANPGFHEAVGDTIALSVATPKHLKKVGLLEEDYPDTYEDNINALMKMALEKVAFLPFGLLIDMWRWDVFAGSVAPDQWNDHWWRLRKEYQLVKPPAPRPAAAFDPGAKYHVPGDSQYISYFIAHVLQFQFHRALCRAAGEYDPADPERPLHKCDIYRSEAAGRMLADGLRLGGSEHWSEALLSMAGTREYSGEPMLEYFRPLLEYLREQNSRERAGERQQDGGTSESPAEAGSQVIPIAVGCVLGGLLMCVLIGYFVFRRRAVRRAHLASPAAAPGKGAP